MTFLTKVVWSGSASGVTRNPASYSRDLEAMFSNQTLPMSAAPEYRGDSGRANPEQLFVAALSSCQALTYLFLAARSGVHVVSYEDHAEGALALVAGQMRMTRVTLRPRIILEEGADEECARELVGKAHANCFIANSVTASVEIEPSITVDNAASQKGERDEARYVSA